MSSLTVREKINAKRDVNGLNTAKVENLWTTKKEEKDSNNEATVTVYNNVRAALKSRAPEFSKFSMKSQDTQ